MKNYLFAKFFRHLTVEELMNTCCELGLDGPTAMIREGYWIRPDAVETDLPRYVQAAREAGLEVAYADTPFDMEKLPTLERELNTLAECGVKLFRVNYITKNAMPARQLEVHLTHLAEIAAAVAEKHGLRAVIQLHGYCYPHNATAAYGAVKDLDPRYIGIKLDPGNNLSQEGYELCSYQVELLGEYIAAVGQKDGAVTRREACSSNGKGWVRHFEPAQSGMANYDELYGELKKHNIQVPGILMPFYHENDYLRMLEVFKDEIAYFKRCQNEAGL
ncbi:MAG: sugar phosphate isomerase/epimerase [Clostridia bacterium]|nr:sugar phosphate isomerase/epimerase [Clostridia bacterium]